MQTKKKQTKKIFAVAAAVAALGIGTAVALASASRSPVSRLDDGRALVSKATISEQDAIKAAQRATTGDLFEVDLEGYDGHLVFNVDVGSHDVKVNAANGHVLSSGSAD
jgi:uncharacterized membrane protein YkoI